MTQYSYMRKIYEIVYEGTELLLCCLVGLLGWYGPNLIEDRITGDQDNINNN